jgi:hypothetical protein
MKNIAVVIAVFLSSVLYSQVSFSGGMGFLKGFGIDKTFTGLNLGIEMPRSPEVTFYGRFGYYFPRREDQKSTTLVTAIDQTTTPFSLQVQYANTFNYVTIEGGTRRYIFNDYDNGFGMYGGSNFMLFFNTVKRDYDKTDISNTFEWEDKYQLPQNELAKGNIISVALGLQGGAKYTLPATGTFFFDVNLQYVILGKANNSVASNPTLYAPLFFTFNLGFRKDLY